MSSIQPVERGATAVTDLCSKDVVGERDRVVAATHEAVWPVASPGCHRALDCIHDSGRAHSQMTDDCPGPPAKSGDDPVPSLSASPQAAPRGTSMTTTSERSGRDVTVALVHGAFADSSGWNGVV